MAEPSTVREMNRGPALAGGAWLPPGLARHWAIRRRMATRGAEAEVYLVSDANGNEAVAKVYRYGIHPKRDVLERVRGIGNRRVIGILEHGEEEGRSYELVERAREGSLRTVTVSGQDEEVVRQIAEGLVALGEQGIEHRDLKPENVLVRSTDPLDLALADFGIASAPESTVHLTAHGKTMRYAPPEAVIETSTVVRGKWDGWSLGMMIVERVTGAHPFEGASDAQIALRLATKDPGELVEGVQDEEWRAIAARLLERDPQKRWTAAQVVRYLPRRNEVADDREDELVGRIPGWGRIIGYLMRGDRLVGYERCPAHRDDEASLAIVRAGNGRRREICLEGCTTDEVAEARSATGEGDMARLVRLLGKYPWQAKADVWWRT